MINTIKNANELFVICKFDVGLCDTTFRDKKVYDSKEEAEKAMDDFQKQIDEKIEELNKLGVTKISRDNFRVISLSTFIAFLGESMYESGRTL